MTGQRGRSGRRSPVFTPHLTSFGAAGGAVRSRLKRLRELPDDLLPLSQELLARGLRASFSLTAAEVAEVREALARHGVAPLVRAAYAAHQPLRPARWWSAWIGLWSGLPTRLPARSAAPPSAADTPPPRRPDVTAAGLTACRAALAARRTLRKSTAGQA
ncbi:hypothetical protein [Frankia sp. AgKG'84/4]|uniref:hypothetical protein n=1 Tax=Frankia sp. AgKG'84/4 TaxID=573490 RepID=UPI00200EF030|nr:hypothetical protein [Frankia sp. AgKG'84/4]MCL9794628.1 hypothetical protein [Frankia sp. AgKG'84/4]